MRQFNWKIIQAEYDRGKTCKQLKKEYGIHNNAIYKAKERGEFKTRSISEFTKLVWTDEKRKEQSLRKKELYKNNPESHPNRKVAHNRNKMSYPEKITYEYLIENKIDFIHNAPIAGFYIDFLIGKVGIEIDGEKWHDIIKDSVRDQKLEKNGIKIIRIKVKDLLYDKNFELLKQAVNGNIDINFLNDFRNRREEEKKFKNCNGRKTKDVCRCGGLKNIHADICKKCYLDKKFILSKFYKYKDELKLKVEECKNNLSKVARYFEVSSKSIEKWCKRLNIKYN